VSRNAPRTFYEFFAGGGMARLGLGDGWTCAFANDFDPVKARTYRANFADAADHFREGDVWEVSPAELPAPVDLAWASSPCQDFSLAGGRAGLRGGRSSAFFGFWRLVEALGEAAPRVIVIENVVGLLTSHGGADFIALCEALGRQGYRYGALEIDAARFTPQSRPRVFVVATRAPVDGVEGPSPFHSPAVRAAHAAMQEAVKAGWVWWRLNPPPARNSDLSSVLEPDEAVRWRSPEETSALLGLMDTRHAAKVAALCAEGGRAVGAVFRRTRAGVQRAEARFDGLAGCLRTPRGGSSRQTLLVVDGGEVKSRLLTAREGARLMGLSDDYRLPSSESAGLHVVGDGVAAPVVAHLARQLIEPLLDAPVRTMAAE
jgi:DNA (cytosine-5)-methyltransferase 1